MTVKKLAVCFVLGVFLLIARPKAAQAAWNLPRLDIELKDIDYDILNSGSKLTAYSGNKVTLTSEWGDVLASSGDVTIKGRGNTSWDKVKKPYQLTFPAEMDFFGLGAAKKWVLLANYYDPTHLRDDFARDVGRLAGIPGTVDGDYADLYINGEYIGLYYMCHRPDAGENSLQLASEFGVLFELDQPYKDEAVDFYSEDGDHFNLKDSVSDKNKTVQSAMAMFEERWNAFSSAVADRDWEKTCQLADVDSFCKYYLLSEFCFNLDSTLTSFFVHMDGPDDIIHAGPAWDYDKSLGNRWGPHPEQMWVYRSLHNTSDPNSHILMKLLDIPEFRSLAARIWKEEMRPAINTSLITLHGTAARIRQSAVVNNVFWEDRLEPDDKAKYVIFDVAYPRMVKWIRQRVKAMDKWFAETDTLCSGAYHFRYRDLYMTADGMSETPAVTHVTVLPDGYCLIWSEEGRYLTCLEIESGNSAPVEAREREPITAQKWQMQSDGRGNVSFYNKDNGLYLCVEGGVLCMDAPNGRHEVFQINIKEEAAASLKSVLTRLSRTNIFAQYNENNLLGGENAKSNR